MPRPEVLENIKAAEREADEILEDAREEREQTIEAAREKANEMIEEAEAEAAQLREERLAEAEETIETRRQDVLAEGKRERDRLVERAEGRTEDVIEYVVDAFEEAVHAQA